MPEGIKGCRVREKQLGRGVLRMRIVIIGAGNAGSHLTAKLCGMNHDVVLIDKRKEALDDVEAKCDVMTIHGSGASPSVLDSAELGKADLLLAVTNRDEVNFVACAYAAGLGVDRKVARVADPAWARTDGEVLRRMGIDMAVCHKEECARELSDILHMTGAIETVDLLDGRVMALAVRIKEGSPVLDGPLQNFAAHSVVSTTRFIARLRGDDIEIPHGDTGFEVGDELYVVTRPEHASALLDWIAPGRPEINRIVIAGGGGLGLGLAERLERWASQVVLIERDAEQAEHCSEVLKSALVMRGDASLQESLENATIGPRTAYLALTGDDELNIISCLVASRMGAAMTIAQIAKIEYVPVVRGLQLRDRVVSPQMSMINAILHFVRAKHVTGAAQLQQLPGELLEVEVSDRNRWADKAVRTVHMPRGALIAALLRDDEVRVPTGSDVLRAGDRLVIFSLPGTVSKTESLFTR